MARQGRVYQGPLFPRVESGSLLAPDKVAARITNMASTPEGSLKSVIGPAPYLPWIGASSAVESTQGVLISAGLSAAHNYFEDYNDTHGIFHAIINNGEREILLLHSGKEIWSFEGWEKGWRVILGPGDSVPGDSTQTTAVRYKTLGIPNESRAQAPTQFEATPNGVVIVPQGSRAFFYDGIVVAPLGYDRPPPAPMGLGPRSASDRPQEMMYTKATGEAYFKNPWDTANMKEDFKVHQDVLIPMRNESGYAHDAQRGFYDGWSGKRQEVRQYWAPGILLNTGMHPAFGRCFVGTVVFPEGMSPLRIRTASDGSGTNAVPDARVPTTVGVLLDGEYYGAVQWIDRWGNLSPVSPRSNAIRFDRQISAGVQIVGAGAASSYGKDNRRYNQVPGAGELVAKQVGWTGIEAGRTGTIGRILYRTRDTLNSGTNELFELPPNASGGTTAYATLPDNISTFYPDNISDARLRRPAPDLVPVPKFSLCRIALGRLWIAGIDDDPGMIRPSLPGLWGTFPANQEICPDPSGGEITGLWSSPRGLLAFTRTSVYLITSTGQGFSTQALSVTVGCVAPSSIVEMPGGTIVWLGTDGFYSMTSENFTPALISVAVGDRLKDLNVARIRQSVAAFDPKSGEYRCWVPIDGTSRNSVCFTYDGEGWRERTDMYEVTDVCTTRNHQSYMLVCGKASGTAQYTEDGTTASGEKGVVTVQKDYADSPANGVWVLDHENHTWLPNPSIGYLLETGWLGSGSSQTRKSIVRVYLWLRETQKPSTALTEQVTTGVVTATPSLALKVSAYTDWRKSRIVNNTVVATPVSYAPMYPEDDPPPAWEQESWSATTETWKRRRPFWVKVEVAIPSCEVFKLAFEPVDPASKLEFLGLSFDMIPRAGGRMPKVTETA
jgi:hypothetical protein